LPTSCWVFKKLRSQCTCEQFKPYVEQFKYTISLPCVVKLPLKSFDFPLYIIAKTWAVIIVRLFRSLLNTFCVAFCSISLLFKLYSCKLNASAAVSSWTSFCFMSTRFIPLEEHSWYSSDIYIWKKDVKYYLMNIYIILSLFLLSCLNMFEIITIITIIYNVTHNYIKDWRHWSTTYPWFIQKYQGTRIVHERWYIDDKLCFLHRRCTEFQYLINMLKSYVQYIFIQIGQIITFLDCFSAMWI